MAKTVDERIVAAKFDASDFEKGVDKTLKKLDELKKSLDLKEATKGVKEFAEKTEVSTNSMSSSLEKLTERFTTFTGMIKQKLLSGIADEVVSVFFKMEQSVKGFLRSISSDQISAGMSKYEQLLTSVRIMMSAGETQGSAYAHIEQLQEYSDQTSYSLSQMTDALSKMRAAGVDLDTATKSVEGIANACANAGINATDAQRAFYNLSQAYSSGVLHYTDYRSLELLNMTTEKFKENMLEAAVEAGTLKKVSDGVYQTISTTDKKVKAGKKVTVKNLNDMLKYDFMNTAAMNKLFGKKFYFDEQEFKKYKKKYTDENGEVDREKAIAEAKKDFGEIAVDAYLAAREARSFTDVINTLKDVVSTGWGSTFEHLFGKLEQAKDFFTKLTESGLADVIYKIGEFRNAILGTWNDATDGVASGGGEVFRQSILNISDALGTLLKTILSIIPGFSDLFRNDDLAPNIDNIGDKLFLLTLDLREMTVRMKNAAKEFNSFMNGPFLEDGTSRIEVIRSVLGNLLSVFKVIGKVAGIVSIAFTKAYQTLYPIFDGILVFIQKITAPLTEISDNEVFKSLEYSIKNIFGVLEPISKVLDKIIRFLGDIAAFFVRMAIDTAASHITFIADAISLIIELFSGNAAQKLKDGEGVIGKLGKDFEDIKTACKDGLAALKEFFSTLIDDTRKLFGLTGDDDQNGGAFSGVINFFKTNQFIENAKNWVSQAIVDVGNLIKSIPSKIKVLGANIYDIIKKLLFMKETDDKTGEEKEVLTPLGEWLNGVIVKVKAFILDIPNKIVSGVGKVFDWVDTIFNAVFGTGEKKEIVGKDEKQTQLLVQFDEFIQSTRESVLNWFKDLPNKISNAFKSVGGFFTNLMNALNEFLFGKKETKKVLVKSKDGSLKTKFVTTRIKTGFSKWLDDFIKDIKKFIINIPEYIKKGIKGAGDIISKIVEGVFGKDDSEDNGLESKIKKPLLDINLENIVSIIKDIGSTLINQIARIFTGTEDIDTNKEWLANKINDAINWVVTSIPAFIKSAWNFAKNVGINVWNGIKAIFDDEGLSEDSPAITQMVANVGTQIKDWLTKEDGLPKYFNDAWTALSTFGSNVWAGFTSIFNEEGLPDDTESSVALLISNIGGKIKDWITNPDTGLPKYINEAWSALSTFGSNVWLGFTSIFSEDGLPEDTESSVALLVSNIGEKIKDWLTNPDTGLPKYINEAWEWLKRVGSEIWLGFTSIFDEDGLPDDTESSVALLVSSIGEKIRDWITNPDTGLPSYINSAWEWLKRVGSEIWIGFTSIFDEDGLPEGTESSVSLLISSIGEKIKDWLTNPDTGLPKYINEAWDKISKFGSDVWTGIQNIFNGTPETDFQQAVINLGHSIYTFMTNKDEGLPHYINSAFEAIGRIFSGEDSTVDESTYIAQSGNNGFKDGIDEALDKEAKKDDKWAFIKTIKQSLINGLVAIGPFILDFFTQKVNRIGDIVSIISNVLSGKKSVADSVEEKLGKDAPELRTAIENFVNSIAVFLSEKLPILLGTALARALEFLSKIGTAVSNVLLGNNDLGGAIEDAFGKENPELNESFTRVGEALKTFFLEIIPTFIGSAIAALINEGPKWFGQMFDALGEALNKSKDEAIAEQTQQAQQGSNENKEKLVDKLLSGGLFDFIKSVVDAISSVLTSDVTATIGVIAAIALLIVSIRDMLSITDEMEEAAATIKWTGISVALIAISGILVALTSLVASGEKGKLDDAEKIIDKLGEFLDRFIVLAAILAGKDLLTIIKNLTAGADSENTIYNATKGATKLFDGITGFAGSLMSAFGKAAAVNVAGGVITAGIDSSLQVLQDTFMDFANSMDYTISLFLPFVDKLADSESKLNKAIAAVDLVKELLVKFYQAFGSLYADATENVEKQFATGSISTLEFYDKNGKRIGQMQNNHSITVTDMTAFLATLRERVEVYYQAAAVCEKLFSTINNMGSLDVTKSKIQDFIKIIDDNSENSFSAVLMKLFNVLNMSFTSSDIFSDRLSYITNEAPYHAIAIGFEILSDALSVFGTAATELKDDKVAAFSKVLDIFEKLGNVMEEHHGANTVYETSLGKYFLGDTTLSKIAKEMKYFAMYIKDFYANVAEIKGFEESEIKTTEAKIAGIIEAGKGILGAFNIVESSFLIGDNVMTLLENLPQLGSAFGGFVSSMYTSLGGLTEEQIRGVVYASSAVSNIMSIISIFASHNVDSIINGVNKNIGTPKNVNGKFTDAFRTLFNQIAVALTYKDNEEEFNTIGHNVAEGICKGIENAFLEDDSLNPTITPVLDLGIAKTQLQEFFGTGQLTDVDLSAMARSAFGANAQTDEERVTAQVLSNEIELVTKAIGELKSSQVTVRDVANAFLGMRVVTNTGALVGALTDDIDAAIGQKIWMIERGVTPAAVRAP